MGVGGIWVAEQVCQGTKGQGLLVTLSLVATSVYMLGKWATS